MQRRQHTLDVLDDLAVADRMRSWRRHRTRWGSFVGCPTSSERFTRGNAGALQMSRARSYRGPDMFEYECQDVFEWMSGTFEYRAKSALLLRMRVRAGQDSMSECSDPDCTQSSFMHARTNRNREGARQHRRFPSNEHHLAWHPRFPHVAISGAPCVASARITSCGNVPSGRHHYYCSLSDPEPEG